MTNYSYIHISVNGQFDGQLRTVYTYPSTGETAHAGWDKSLPDPQAVIKNFLNVRECYVMWHTPQGHYFALITRNPLDPSSGYISLTLMVADGFSLAGRQIVNTLTALKRTLLEDSDRFDDAVTRCLEAVGIPREGTRLESWTFKEGGAKAAERAADCYRTYVSGQELETILSFPGQPEYARFDRVMVIAATASLRPGMHIDRITTPVRKMFTVICPAGVTPSKDVVAEGERLTLTYTKAGFSPRKENVIVGAPSPYVRYEGSAIRAKSAAESGMGFVRRVKLVVKSSKGGLVNGYTINVNGRPVNTMDPYIDLNEHEMSPGSKTEISVASNNYRPLKVVRNSADLAGLETLELLLTPMEQGIILRLDFGEGRVFEQEISIEKSTPEYSQLHSGNFHGFRAHRTAAPGGGEVYNVDVRASNRPVAPAFTNVAAKTTQGSSRMQAPVFENVSHATEEERRNAEKHRHKKVDIRKPDSPRRDNDNDDNNENEEGYISRDNRNKKYAYIVGGALALMLLVLAFVFILPKGSGTTADDDTHGDSITAEAYSGDPQALAEDAARNNPAASATPAGSTFVGTTTTAAPDAEKQDLEYLNGNKVWEREKIKSAKYQALFDMMNSGDFEAIVNNDYFAVKGAATNKEAISVAECLWGAIGTPNKKANERALSKNVSNSKIDIHQLYEDLARCRPAQPNPAPRPQR